MAKFNSNDYIQVINATGSRHLKVGDIGQVGNPPYKGGEVHIARWIKGSAPAPTTYREERFALATMGNGATTSQDSPPGKASQVSTPEKKAKASPSIIDDVSFIARRMRELGLKMESVIK